MVHGRDALGDGAAGRKRRYAVDFNESRDGLAIEYLDGVEDLGTWLKRAVMREMFAEGMPWFFDIKLDEEKALACGYDIDCLYGRIEHIASAYGLIRIGDHRWQAKDKDSEFTSISCAYISLSKCEWLRETLAEWLVYDEEDPLGEDCRIGLGW